MKLLYFFLWLTALSSVNGIGELHNNRIPVVPSREGCHNTETVRPCPPTRGENNATGTYPTQLGATTYPPNWPCPCKVEPGSGQWQNPTGIQNIPNADSDFFVDRILVDGIDNPIQMAFTDNTNELFVATRAGFIWYVNLETGQKKIFLDLSDDVGFSGDRGMMSITTHPGYATQRFVFVIYTVDPTPGDGVEPNALEPVDQKLVRIEDLGGGNVNPTYEAGSPTRILLGGIDPVTGLFKGPPACYNTHAAGTIKFANDLTLMVTTGEGAHWNYDWGDWGQNGFVDIGPAGTEIPSFDHLCEQRFGADQDVGAFRSQIKNSLSGKLLRITPDIGQGVCEDSLSFYVEAIVKNPFCDGSGGNSAQSKVWALGLRNPFRMTLKPFTGVGPVPMPGHFFVGDVGQGGYEEINAITEPATNFGWPCWEGPFPCPLYRDSLFNFDPLINITGCPGNTRFCGPITTLAMWEGTRITCPWQFHNQKTELPWYYYTRFRNDDNAGYFQESGYMGQSATTVGNSVAGLAFYSGNSYPERYRYALFALDYEHQWIRALFSDENGNFDHAEDFYDLNQLNAGGTHSLEVGPNGDICYLNMDRGQIRCLTYAVTNIGPTINIGAIKDAGTAPLTVQFDSTGSYDRENDPFIINWNFGDGTTAQGVSPVHTYTQSGVYSVVATGIDKFGNTGNGTMSVYVLSSRPQVTITSPAANPTTKIFGYTSIVQDLTFSATVVDSNPGQLTYQWEFQLVHNGHIHPGELFVNSPTFNTASLPGGHIPEESAPAGDRTSVKLICRVTNQHGLVGSDFIRLFPSNYMTLYSNSPPVPVINHFGFVPYQVGQPVRFSNVGSLDPDGDIMDFLWNFGDGFTSSHPITAHSWTTPGMKTIRLTATDSFGTSSSVEEQIFIDVARAITPVANPPGGKIYQPITLVLSSIQPEAIITYTLNGGDPECWDTLYTEPIPIPYYPNMNVTLKLVAFVDGQVPSEVVEILYEFIPPPCTEIAFRSNKSLDCINTLISLEEPGIADVPEAAPFPPEGPPSWTDKTPPSDYILEYAITQINGVVDTGRNEFTNTTRLSLWVNQGTAVGATIIAEIGYDYNGDGEFERKELLQNWGPDPIPETWEEWNENDFSKRFAPWNMSYVHTPYQPLINGTIRVRVWEAIPSQPTSSEDPLQFRIGQGVLLEERFQISKLIIPYKNTYKYQNYGEKPNIATPPSVPGPCSVQTATPLPTPTNSQTTSGETSGNKFTNASNLGLIVGAAVAAIVLLGLCIFLAICLVKRRKSNREPEHVSESIFMKRWANNLPKVPPPSDQPSEGKRKPQEEQPPIPMQTFTRAPPSSQPPKPAIVPSRVVAPPPLPKSRPPPPRITDESDSDDEEAMMKYAIQQEKKRSFQS